MARDSKKYLDLKASFDSCLARSHVAQKAVSDLVAGRVVWLPKRTNGYRIGFSRLTGAAGGIVYLDSSKINQHRACSTENLDSWARSWQRNGNLSEESMAWREVAHKLLECQRAAYAADLHPLVSADEVRRVLKEAI